MLRILGIVTLLICVNLGPTQSTVQTDNQNITNSKYWTARSGNWNFSKKTFKAQAFIKMNKAYYNKKIFEDFIFEVKINKLAEDGTFGLIFRYDEINDIGYALQFWPHGGCIFSIDSKVIHLRKLEINQPNNQLIGNRVWNTLKITGHNSEFKFYLNDILLDTVIDNTFSSGRLGLCLEGDPRQTALFEVIRIEPL